MSWVLVVQIIVLSAWGALLTAMLISLIRQPK